MTTKVQNILIMTRETGNKQNTILIISNTILFLDKTNKAFILEIKINEQKKEWNSVEISVQRKVEKIIIISGNSVCITTILGLVYLEYNVYLMKSSLQ